MSLRTDIHSAFDEVAPSTLGMTERVIESVAMNPTRARRPGWVVSFRGPASLVAVFLLVALVAVALVGGRVLQDWNAFTHPQVPAVGPNRSVVMQLEARHDQLPVLKAGASCPDGPEANNLYGAGPVYGAPGWPRPATALQLAGNFSTSWGFYFYNTVITIAGLNGPVLMRGRDLRSNRPIVFVGDYATGPLLGTDTVDGRLVQQHAYLMLDMNHPPSTSSGTHELEWPVILGIDKHWSDCVGLQFDGPGFTETWVVYRVGAP
jgi:hypothetical protein